MKDKQSVIRFICFNVPIVLLIISTIFLNANYIIKGIKAENSIEDINFDSPFNNAFEELSNSEGPFQNQFQRP